MRYHVRIGARTFTVDVEGDRVVLDGLPLEAHCDAVPGTPLHHLLLGAQSWTVNAQALEGRGAGGAARWALGLAGERVEVEVVDDRTHQILALTGRRAEAAGGAAIRAPMPGLVVRVEVTEGQLVAAGAGVVVVEAMKMENELRAPRAGRVVRVHVQAGTAVEKGAILVTLDADDGAEPSS